MLVWLVYSHALGVQCIILALDKDAASVTCMNIVTHLFSNFCPIKQQYRHDRCEVSQWSVDIYYLLSKISWSENIE
jgi:hypothetical protein